MLACQHRKPFNPFYSFFSSWLTCSNLIATSSFVLDGHTNCNIKPRTACKLHDKLGGFAFNVRRIMRHLLVLWNLEGLINSEKNKSMVTVEAILLSHISPFSMTILARCMMIREIWCTKMFKVPVKGQKLVQLCAGILKEVMHYYLSAKITVCYKGKDQCY